MLHAAIKDGRVNPKAYPAPREPAPWRLARPARGSTNQAAKAVFTASLSVKELGDTENKFMRHKVFPRNLALREALIMKAGGSLMDRDWNICVAIGVSVAIVTPPLAVVIFAMAQ